MNNHKAFTLIEILVVIAILAGFMALLVPNMMLVRMKARDMRRKSDLKAIQKALEMYKLNQPLPVYPEHLTACSALSDPDSLNTYMAKVPSDPLTNCPSPAIFYQYIPTADNSSYSLTACLENTNDPEKIAACPVGFTCTGRACYQLTPP